MNDALIKTFSKKTGKSEPYIRHLCSQITEQLLSDGITEEEKRFYPYLTTKLKKALGIKESTTVLKRFKTFLHEKQTN